MTTSIARGKMTITEVSVAEAKARLSALLQEVENGAEVVITRRGRPIARVAAVERKLQPIDLSEADRIRGRQKRVSEPSAKWLREMRDNARY
ncbi:MAG TPA: type II toxin-antitoxin system prevent-host-death family antitoxin [Terriglobales bacterium]|jgi:prevent-host-death family protein